MTIRRGALSFVSLFLMISGLLLLSGPQAEARTFSSASSFGFGTNPIAFLGQVSSNSDRCEAGRLVKVFRERDRNDRLIGRDRASSSGQWEVYLNNVPLARYYALIPKKKFGPNGRDVCRQYKTSTIRVGS